MLTAVDPGGLDYGLRVSFQVFVAMLGYANLELVPSARSVSVSIAVSGSTRGPSIHRECSHQYAPMRWACRSRKIL